MIQAKGDIQDVLDGYYAEPKFQRSIAGAESAWRGYGLQTLYICSRLLNETSGEFVYRPESVEDLMIVDSSSEAAGIELVQVKALSDPLTFSHIASGEKDKKKKTGKSDEFFGHVAYLLGKGVSVSAKVVVYGTLGDELARFADGDSDARTGICNKVRKLYGVEIANWCEINLSFEALDEDVVRADVEAAIGGLFEVSIAPALFLNTVTAIVRDKSEHRGSLTLAEIKEMARRAGISIAAFSGYAKQYGKKLFPLSLRFSSVGEVSGEEDYKLGVNAQPEHIAAGLDVVRVKWLDAIDDAFASKDTVVVQGASGQGKSTLCLRYLYDRVPICDSYYVDGNLTAETAGDIASCLVELAKQVKEKLFVYFDGASGESWIWLARQLRERGGGNIRLLVSIRDDDMNQLSISSKELPCSFVRPTLSRNEAEVIYGSYENPAFPSFNESWLSFGEMGPLMEYTASLETGSTIFSTLESQIIKLCQEGHSDAWLYALYLASVIGSEGSTLSAVTLGRVAGCEEMVMFVERAKNEHLLRIDESGLIGPLHPYRSKLIAQILKEKLFVEDEQVMVDIAKCVTDKLGTILVRLTNDKVQDSLPDAGKLVDAADCSWIKLSEVLKYALWCDTRRLFFKTADLRRRMKESGIAPSLLFMLAGGVASERSPFDFETLFKLADECKRADLERLLHEATKCKVEYSVTKHALISIEIEKSSVPRSSSDLQAAGFVLTQFVAQGLMLEKLSAKATALAGESDFKRHPLTETLDFVMGVKLCGGDIPESSNEILESRIAEVHCIAWHSFDGNEVDVLQIPYDNCDDLNDCIVEALGDYRRLHPNAKYYSGRQLGTNVFVPQEILPEIDKHIPAANLPIYLLNLPDRLFLSMCDYDEAPESWILLKESIVSITHDFLKMTAEYIKAINKWYEKGTFLGADQHLLDSLKKLIQDTSGFKVSVPKESLDPQGFTSYLSSADPRGARNVDSASVAGAHAQSARFLKTSKLLNTINLVSSNCIAPMKLLKTGADDGKVKQQIRGSIVMLGQIIEIIPAAEMEIRSAFGDRLMPNDFLDSALNLSCIFNHCLSEKIRKMTSVAYAQRIRSRKLLKASDLISERICSNPAITKTIVQNSKFAFEVDLNLIGEDETFEDIAAKAITSLFGDLSNLSHLTESVFLPPLIGEVVIIYLLGDCFFGCAKASGFQIVQYADQGKSILWSPVQELPTAAHSYPKHYCIDAYQTIQGIKLLCSVCSNVNSALLEKESSLEHIADSGYASWRTFMDVELSRLTDSLEVQLEEVFSIPKVDIVELITGLRESIKQVPECADCSEFETSLEQLANLVMDQAKTEFENESDRPKANLR